MHHLILVYTVYSDLSVQIHWVDTLTLMIMFGGQSFIIEFLNIMFSAIKVYNFNIYYLKGNFSR